MGTMKLYAILGILVLVSTMAGAVWYEWGIYTTSLIESGKAECRNAVTQASLTLTQDAFDELKAKNDALAQRNAELEQARTQDAQTINQQKQEMKSQHEAMNAMAGGDGTIPAEMIRLWNKPARPTP